MQANRNSQTTSTKCQYQAAASKPKCFSGLKWPDKRAEQADDQEDGSDDDMEAVEAGRHEEGRAIDVAAIVAAEGESGVGIFIGLDGGEQEAEHDGAGEAPFEALAVVVEQRVMRPGDGGARGQEDQRVDQRQMPGIEDLDALGRPFRRRSLRCARPGSVRR